MESNSVSDDWAVIICYLALFSFIPSLILVVLLYLLGEQITLYLFFIVYGLSFFSLVLTGILGKCEETCDW